MNAEVYVNGQHSVAFKGTSKSMTQEDKKGLLSDVDNLQTLQPLDSMQIDVVGRIPSNVAKERGFKYNGYNHPGGKKIVLTKETASNRTIYSKNGIYLTDPTWHMPSRVDVPGASYTMAHEWGHAIAARKGDPLYLDSKISFSVTKGLANGGFLSTYGKKNNGEAYAETFAEFVSTNGSSTNPVVQNMAKEFSW
jgi:hypothetical protein